MKKKCLIAIIFLISILAINIYAKAENIEPIIRVGVYEVAPYYQIDEKGQVSGYYNDLLILLQKEYPFQYEYVIGDLTDLLANLKTGNIDIMLGISISEERLKEIIYNKQPVAVEKFALYSNKKSVNSVNDLDNVKIGLVTGSVTEQITLNYFSNIGVEVEAVPVNNWPDLEELFKEGKIDIMPHDLTVEREGYQKIYEFSGDQVYIAANKDNRDILDKMDEAIIKLRNKDKDPIDELYKKYFGDINGVHFEKFIKFGIPLILILVGYGIYGRVKLKQKKIQEKIRFNMRSNNYFLQYQPIYNPQNEVIVGFEGLLRMWDKNKKLIPPFQFIPEIEDNHMLFEVSLWILERVIKEYSEIRQYNCVKDREFYISLNVSLKEIENNQFVEEASKLLMQSKLGSNKICLEIVERIKVKNVDKVSENIKRLKNIGFKIAIDDFGTEYSNLDRLLNLDTDIIKIDKYFIENIDKDKIKNEIVTFISRIAEVKGKTIVLEGIEEESEALVIKNMKKNLIYVQGYYYNKPLFKEEIKFI